jgi:diguanylate cyclase (GGDEF)-like protein
MLQTSVEYGYKRAEQFIKKISELKITFGDQTLTNVTISVGLSAYPKHGDTMDKLIKSADEALYRAKSLGKNQVVTVDELGNSQKPEHPFTDK